MNTALTNGVSTHNNAPNVIQEKEILIFLLEIEKGNIVLTHQGTSIDDKQHYSSIEYVLLDSFQVIDIKKSST